MKKQWPPPPIFLGFVVSCGPTTRIAQAPSVLRQVMGPDDCSLLAEHQPSLLRKIGNHESLELKDLFVLNELGFSPKVMINIIDFTHTKISMDARIVVQMQEEGISFQVITYLIGLCE